MYSLIQDIILSYTITHLIIILTIILTIFPTFILTMSIVITGVSPVHCSPPGPRGRVSPLCTVCTVQTP